MYLLKSKNKIKFVVLGKNKTISAYIRNKESIQNDIIELNGGIYNTHPNAFFICTSWWDRNINGVKSNIYYTENTKDPIMLDNEKTEIESEILYKRVNSLVKHMATLMSNKISTIDVMMLMMMICCIGACIYAINEIHTVGQDILSIMEMLRQLQQTPPIAPVAPVTPVATLKGFFGMIKGV